MSHFKNVFELLRKLLQAEKSAEITQKLGKFEELCVDQKYF